MGPEFLKTLAEVLQTAGGYGMAALGFYLFFKERSYSQLLNAKILELGIKGTEATVAVNNTLLSLKDLFKELRELLTKRE